MRTPAPDSATPRTLLAALAIAAGAAGCTFAPELGTRPSPPPETRSLELPADFPNWPIPPGRAEALLAQPRHDVRFVESTAAGTSGAEKIVVQVPGLGELALKSKRVPDLLDGVNNSPRKELAAYEAQKLFLEPVDYIVPTTAVRCQPVEVWHEHHEHAHPQLGDASCVLLVVSLWLKDVTVPAPLYDRERFTEDPVYARYLADFNLLTYLIDHRDGRDGNFLVSRDDARRQVFAVDNGISFGPTVFNYFVPNWDVLRVGGLRKSSVDRLRELDRDDLDALLVVGELRNDGSGQYVSAAHTGPMDVHRGVGSDDDVVQFGLTEHEIDSLWERLEDLLDRVDDDEIELF